MKPSIKLRAFLVGSSLLASPVLYALDGTWNVDGNGLWSDTTKWAGGPPGVIATGSGFTANFTNNISADRTVSLDSDRTLTNVVFGDSDTSTAGSWIINNNAVSTNNLILAGTTPTITVNALGTNKTATIAAIIEGTVGMTKAGNGTLILTNKNTYSGNTLISGGVLDLSTVVGAAIYSNANSVTGTSVTVGTGGVLVISDMGAGNVAANFSLGNLAAVASSLVLDGGTLRITAATSGRGRAVSIGANGGTIEVNSTGYSMQYSGTQLNSYADNSTLTLSGTGSATMQKGITGTGVAVVKDGIGTWILAPTTTANSYTGATTVNTGVLSIRAASALGTTAGGTSVASGAALEIQGAISVGAEALQLNGTGISNGGALRNTLNDNTYGGAITLNGSTRINSDSGTLTLDVASGNAITATDQNLTFGGSGNITVADAIATGSGTLTKDGAGTTTLSGANSYSGTTTLGAGTLALSGGNNRLLSTGTLDITGTSTFDIGSTSQTLASITVPNLASVNSTITGSGGSLIINGASNVQWGPGGEAVGTTSYNTVVNMGGLSNFTYDASDNTFRVGYKGGTSNGTGAAGTSTVTFAANNTITAANLFVADQAASNNGGTHTLSLGAANLLKVGNISVGFSGRSNGTLDFSAPGSAATIRNTDGNSAVTSWNVGRAVTFNNTVWTSTVDLTNGTVDALVTSMRIGSADIGGGTGRGGTTNASFTMGAGTLTVGTMNVGEFLGNAGSTAANPLVGNGTFTLNNASGTVNVTTLNLATNTGLTGGAGAKAVSGTFNLTAGTLNATTVQQGTQGGTATATLAFNWTDGTIGNLAGTDLTWNDVPIALTAGTHAFDISGNNTATLNSASIISGGSGINKQGTGRLVLNAANTYTGATNVNAGTLEIAATGSTDILSAVSVSNSGSALVVNGTVSGTLNASASTTISGTGTVVGNADVSGNLTPGNGAGVLAFGGSLTMVGTTATTMEILGLGRDTEYDGVDVIGTLTYDGALTLAIGATFGADASFDLFDFGVPTNQTGSFDTMALTGSYTGTLVNNGSGVWDTTTNAGNETWVFDQSTGVLSLTVIPEPSTALLGALGMLALLRRRR